MSGRLPIIGVIGFGFVAALCAALLMASLRSDSGEAPGAAKVAMLVAARDVPAMTELAEADVRVREVAPESVPEGRLSDPVEAVGRVVKDKLVAGEAVTGGELLDEGAGAQLASSLPEGKRAVSVKLPQSSAMRGLLYPGSRVDVLFARSGRYGNRGGGDQSSRTLLQNVRVLAVNHRTLFTPSEGAGGEDGEEGGAARRRSGDGLMVTLLVDPQQARELQAAREAGELSLSLRNPRDESMTEDPSDEGESSLADAAVERGPEPWQTVVIRGGTREVERFNGDEAPPGEERERMSSAESDGPAPEIDQ